ncbi:hypothetical protein FHG87_005060, partial [Trinorchestia longiramus]
FPRFIKSILYLDDLAIYKASHHLESLERQVQIAMNRLECWSDRTRFRFSATKTGIMHICRMRGCARITPNLYEQNITLAQTYKYVGVTFDERLTWRPHIRKLRTACFKALNLLKNLAHSSYDSDKMLLLRLYMTSIKLKIDFDGEAYGSACSSLLETVQPIQNAALRIATGAFRSSSLISLRAEAGIKILDQHRSIKILDYYLRLLIN